MALKSLSHWMANVVVHFPVSSLDTSHYLILLFWQVLTKALSWLPEIFYYLDNLTAPSIDLNLLLYRSKQVNAALAALGGFKETIKPGCLVQVRNIFNRFYMP